MHFKDHLLSTNNYEIIIEEEMSTQAFLLQLCVMLLLYFLTLES